VEVGRIQQRYSLQDNIKLLGKKKPWIEFEQMKAEARLLSKERDEAKAALDKLRADQEPLR